MLSLRPIRHCPCCCLCLGNLPTASHWAAQKVSSAARLPGAAAHIGGRSGQRTQRAQLSGPRRRRGQFAVVAAVKRKTDKHVVCSKTIVATPETAGRVVELCKGMMEFSQRRAAEPDSGILAFDVSQDIYDSNVVHFWERYESNAHMGRHNTTPEFNKFMQAVVDLIQEPIGIALYEMKDGQISNVCIQGGPKGEGGLDDASGGNGGSGGASMKQSSGAVDLGKSHRGEGDTAWGMNIKFPWQKTE